MSLVQFAFASILAASVTDFWDTTAYAKAEPAVTAVAVPAAADATVLTRIPVTIPAFNSCKPGMMIIYR